MPGYWVADAYTANPMWNVKELEKRGLRTSNPPVGGDFADPKLPPDCNINNITHPCGCLLGHCLKRCSATTGSLSLRKGKPALAGKGDLEKKEMGGHTRVSYRCYRADENAQDLQESGLEIEMLWPKEGASCFRFPPHHFLPRQPHPNTAQLFIDYVRERLTEPTKMAETGVGLHLLAGQASRFGKRRKFMPPSEDIKAIPMDWNKERARRR